MPNFPTPENNTRLGFHYFPDVEHYRQNDLRTWLPELKDLGANWLILVAPLDRAIPEEFLRGLVRSHIEPVLQFDLPLGIPSSKEDLTLLFSIYARWGLHYVILFDRPNIHKAWPNGGWAQDELVERFLDHFIPLAESARQAGLIPVFPPLEPGGDYWDTAFLRAAFQAMKRRGLRDLLDNLVLAAYANPGERPLNWGFGGPESWPGARPYFTPSGSEDQRGFRIFDWYLTIVQAATGKSIPIFLLGSGNHQKPLENYSPDMIDDTARTLRNLTIARCLAGDRLEPYMADPLETIPAEIMAGSFWLLSADQNSIYLRDAWFKPDGKTLPIVSSLRQWFSGYQIGQKREELSPKDASEILGELNGKGHSNQPISHYLLLPSYEWGVPDWYLEAIQPFIKKYQPTIGFSIEEATLARLVTVARNKEIFSEQIEKKLVSAGCKVEYLDLVAQELQQKP
jgi:hypothetical protein